MSGKFIIRIALAGAALAASSVGATAAFAATGAPVTVVPGVTTSVSVPAAQAFTDTGIALTAGEQFTVSATGTPCYHAGSGCYGPNGLSFRSASHGYACSYNQYVDSPVFTAPGLNCWSLIGRIGGSGVVFQVGKSLTLTSPVSGELWLGANDNYYPDNSGAYTASITTP